jgi:hypothetical protein
MRSTKEVLPTENRVEYEKLRAKIRAALAPADAAQEVLVDRFVRLEWRGQRGEAAETAAAQRKIHDVVDGAANRDAAFVDRLRVDLVDYPENQRELLRMPAGIQYMIDEWTIYQDRLQTFNSLLSSQRKRVLALLGKRREDVFRDDRVATRWMRALIGARLTDERSAQDVANQFGDLLPDGISQSEFDIRIEHLARSLPTRKEAHAQLVSYVAEEIARLQEHLKVIVPLARRDLELAAEEATVQTTPEGARLASYILGSYRGSDASLVRLGKLQHSPRPGPGKGPKPAGETAAPVAPAPAPAPAGPTDAAPRPEATAGAHAPPSEPAPTSPPPQTDEPISAPQGATTTDDLPVPEMSDEEMDRYNPEFARARKLNGMLRATYGTRDETSGSGGPSPAPAGAVAGGGRDTGVNPATRPSDPRFCTDEAISRRAPPADPSPPGAVRAPPGGT